jgi:hypothetical protein
MTIICYRDGIMAADSLVSMDWLNRGSVQKIIRGPDGCIAASSGTLSGTQRFNEWVASGRKKPFDPKCEAGKFGAIVVEKGGRVRVMQNEGVLCGLEAPFYAEGCGVEFVVGAMAAGATAESAVRLYLKWSDSGVGGAVQVERLYPMVHEFYPSPGTFIPVIVEVTRAKDGLVFFKSDDGTEACRRITDVLER